MSTKEEQKAKEQELIRAESIRLESERKIDQELSIRGLEVDVHHFKIESERVKGITILTLDKSKVSREQLGEMIYKAMWETTKIYGKILAYPLKNFIQNRGYQAIAICDSSDEFNETAGRIKAKRRLLRIH
jgi:hypothetical protein